MQRTSFFAHGRDFAVSMQSFKLSRLKQDLHLRVSPKKKRAKQRTVKSNNVKAKKKDLLMQMASKDKTYNDKA